MRNFADLLCERIQQLNNPTVMGLDPKLEYIPDTIISNSNSLYPNDIKKASAHAILEFNKKLIDATYEIIPAIKPQFAYYEMYGLDGIHALYETIKYAKSKDMLVISDAKRNDIGTTAEAYARSIIGDTDFGNVNLSMIDSDAVTVNAYLGSDGINPFLNFCETKGKGIYVLVRTSNPSAGELQDLDLIDGRKVYEAMADMVNEWGRNFIGNSGYSSVGAVVGATWPEQAVEARKRMPNTLILVPGYGAQGAGADNAVASFSKDGRGSIVNASRSLMCAWKKRSDLSADDFWKATIDEAIDMRDKLNYALANRIYV